MNLGNGLLLRATHFQSGPIATNGGVWTRRGKKKKAQSKQRPEKNVWLLKEYREIKKNICINILLLHYFVQIIFIVRNVRNQMGTHFFTKTCTSTRLHTEIYFVSFFPLNSNVPWCLSKHRVKKRTAREQRNDFLRWYSRLAFVPFTHFQRFFFLLAFLCMCVFRVCSVCLGVCVCRRVYKRNYKQI